MSRFIYSIDSHEATDAGRFGPKAANLARLKQQGLPVPAGFAMDAEAYRTQVRSLHLEEDARGVFGSEDGAKARQHALAMKLGILDQPIAAEILEGLLERWRALRRETNSRLVVVRSSALVEDRLGSSFAGQFESFLGIETEDELVTAVRSCWSALWATRALRYMAARDIDPAQTAMAVLVQPLVEARAAGGGLSRAHGGGMVLNATPGLGASVAQGEVAPDRYNLDREGKLLQVVTGNMDVQIHCAHQPRQKRKPGTHNPCLSSTEVTELGRILRETETLMGMPVEIEWAIGNSGPKLLQARPLHVSESSPADTNWIGSPRLNGHPAGVGWGAGPACVIGCECELARVRPGDVLVTRAATPALSHILPMLAGFVSERGGSTSHLASLARERGIPMVLGVSNATERIPDGSTVAVDGIAGLVRWAG